MLKGLTIYKPDQRIVLNPETVAVLKRGYLGDSPDFIFDVSTKVDEPRKTVLTVRGESRYQHNPPSMIGALIEALLAKEKMVDSLTVPPELVGKKASIVSLVGQVNKNFQKLETEIIKLKPKIFKQPDFFRIRNIQTTQKKSINPLIPTPEPIKKTRDEQITILLNELTAARLAYADDSSQHNFGRLQNASGHLKTFLKEYTESQDYTAAELKHDTKRIKDALNDYKCSFKKFKNSLGFGRKLGGRKTRRFKGKKVEKKI